MRLVWRVGAVAAAALLGAPGNAVMSPVECANLASMLAKGPSFKGLQTRVKDSASTHELREVTGYVAPFERCVVLDSIGGTSLSCVIQMPIEGVSQIDPGGHAYLKKELTGMARDIAACLGQALPAVEGHKPISAHETGYERFGWTFVAPPPQAADARRVMGATLSARLPKAGAALRPPATFALDAEFESVTQGETAQWLQQRRRAWAAADAPPERPAAARAPEGRLQDWQAALSSVAGIRGGDTIDAAAKLFGAPERTDAPADSSLSHAYWFDGGLSIAFDRRTRRIDMLGIRDQAAVAALRKAGADVGFPVTLLGRPADAFEQAFGPPTRVRNSFYRWRGVEVFEFRVFCLQGRDCQDFHVHWR